MKPTELTLNPQKPLPPPRRFEITLDGRSHAVMITPTRGPAPPPKTLWVPGKYEIKGDCTGDDESRELTHDAGTDALIVDSLYGLHRPGEDIGAGMAERPFGIGQQVPSYPGGNVITRERLNHLVRSGRLKRPDNMVNSFRSGRLRRRAKPFSVADQYEAAALVNPGAYHGIALSTQPLSMNGAVLARGVAGGQIVIGSDGTVYKRIPRDETGAIFKKIGKIAKGAAKGVAKGTKAVGKGIATGAKATGKGIATGAKATGKGIATGAKAVGKVTVSLAKLTAKGALEIARLISSAAATPIRMAFLYKVGRPRAYAIARSKGRKSPNALDKREAVAWGFQKLRHMKPAALGVMTMHILKFTRGVPLAGVSGQQRAEAIMAAAEMGVEPATITAYATAAAASIAALAATLKFAEGLTKGDLKKAGEGAQEFQQVALERQQAEEARIQAEKDKAAQETTPTDQTAPQPEQPAYEQPAYEQPAYEEQPVEQQTSSEGWSLISFRPYNR